jgi:hypothetical protein
MTQALNHVRPGRRFLEKHFAHVTVISFQVWHSILIWHEPKRARDCCFIAGEPVGEKQLFVGDYSRSQVTAPQGLRPSFVVGQCRKVGVMPRVRAGVGLSSER